MHCRLLLLLMLLNASTAWSSDFDVDNDGVVAPLTDGLLVLRHFFGFTGTALTEGALGADATNTTAEMIQAHINDRPDRFDLDGDGLHQPLTDGLLLLRLLFGFTGEVLTQGAQCPRRGPDATNIEPLLTSCAECVTQKPHITHPLIGVTDFE